MRMNAKQIASCTGGTFVVQPIDARVITTGLSWDSREVKAGDIYVALPGERVDGHTFVAAALQAGATVVLVMQPIEEETKVLAREMGAAIIEVSDTTHAISDLAREWRGHLKGRVIGLTGSTGKTTTKNLIRDVLSAKYSVVATEGNQNNELGVPKTILSADPETEMIVVEMGMRGLGQIADLCKFVRPNWGVITNIGDSHIELLGSRENIACAKAELLDALGEGPSVACLNTDDTMSELLWSIADFNKETCARIGFDGSGDYYTPRKAYAQQYPAVWAEDIELDEQGCPHFTLCACGFSHPGSEGVSEYDIEREDCTLVLRGLHNVANACAAAAIGCQCDIDLATIARVLAQALPEAGRQEVLKARGGFTVVNDAYNANPDSMRASLSTFCALEVKGRRVAVLGDMGELGEYAQACHEGIGQMAATLPLDRLICVGELAGYIADAAERAGMDSGIVVRAHSIADVLGDLDAYVQPGDAVLVKASHFMELERVVEGLIN